MQTNHQTGSAPPPDFYLEFYKAHRAHEVALNNATALYEQSILRLVLVFNAAALGGLLALMQAVEKRSSIDYNFGRARMAMISWIIGIALAFIASFLAYRSQVNYTKAYRSRRQAVEALRGLKSADDSGGPDWPARFGIETDADPKKLTDNADSLRKDAELYYNRAIRVGALALLAAIIGLGLALASVTPGRVPEITC